MRKIFITILLLILQHYSFAIDFYRVVGGRPAAIGRTGVCDRDLWSLQNNPAGTALLEGWHCGLYYENQWMLKETAFKGGAVAKAIPKVGCLGLSVCQFGGSVYSENKFGLSYARGFGPYLQMGLQVDYLWLHWDGYPSRGALSFSLGIQSQVTEKLRFGACLYNPVQRRLKTLNEDRLPTVMRFGMAYQFSDDFVGQCEVERDDSREGVRLGGGIEYQVFGKFSLRAGAQYNPNVLSFGVGYRVGRVRMDVAAQMHMALGATVMLGACFN